MAVYKDQKIFDMLTEGAGFALRAAKLFFEMTGGITPEEQSAAVKRAAQHAGRHIRTLCCYLEAAFITPIDRDDVYKIAKKTDDITAAIVLAADKLWMMNITRINAHIKAMAGYIIDACEKLTELMPEIKNYKKKNKTGEKAEEIREIKRMGARRYKGAVRDLFIKERDPIELIKMKEIYERLMEILNSCESAADCVQAILATKT